MTDELVLLVTTAGVALTHTVVGPDHYLPFIAMFRAGQWTRSKTLRITLICGIGHITASLVLGLVGVWFGLSIAQTAAFESVRGSIAAWILILFGLGYGAWGMRRALRGRDHSHWHAHPDGSVHDHEHHHEGEHVHVHQANRVGVISLWALFAVFVLGPCEPLIPLMLVPAASGTPGRIVAVAGVFTAVTLASMLAIVAVATAGTNRALALPRWRFGHALAGGLVGGCGLLMMFAGL